MDKFNGCCRSCPDHPDCPEACEYDPADCREATFDEETGREMFKESQRSTLEQITTVVSQKKALEEQEKTLKAALFTAMEKFKIKNCDTNVLTLIYIAPTMSHTIDSAKLKKKYPDVAAECTKGTPKAGYVKITLKGGEKV